jgi:hypothetical protein
MNAQGTQQGRSAWGAWVSSLRRVMVVRESQERQATDDRRQGSRHEPRANRTLQAPIVLRARFPSSTINTTTVSSRASTEIPQFSDQVQTRSLNTSQIVS